MGLTVHMNDGKSQDREGVDKSSSVIISTSSAGVDVIISTNQSERFKPTLSIKQSDDLQKWRSRQVHNDICIINEVDGNTLLTTHGCGQIKVDGNILISLDGCSGQSKNNSEENKSIPTTKVEMDYIRRMLEGMVRLRSSV